MKRPYTVSFFVLAAVSLLQSQPPQPVYKWYPLGPENVKINCILVRDTSLILAGTDKGVMVRFADKWYQATSGLPVRALARVSHDRIAAAIGDGKSKSDGIYIGKNIINGPPFYHFEILQWMENPEALAVSEPGHDTLYAGSPDVLYRFRIPPVLSSQTDPAAYDPVAIKLPPGAFGVEMPSCRALELFTGRLVAGGYDQSPEPGPGHLLYDFKDSMRILRTMNVSAMAVANLSAEGLGPASFVAGTTDSGIYTTENLGLLMPPVKPWARFDCPNKEPVNHLIATPTFLFNDALLVAVKSGVFLGGNGHWTEVGAIPVEPRCLALVGNGHDSYVAGTDKGVYRYGVEPSTGIAPAFADGRVFAAALGGIAANGEPRMVVFSMYAGGVEIAVTDVSGKLVCKHAVTLSPGENRVALPPAALGRGIYIVSVRGERFAPLSRMVTLGK